MVKVYTVSFCPETGGVRFANILVDCNSSGDVANGTQQLYLKIYTQKVFY